MAPVYNPMNDSGGRTIAMSQPGFHPDSKGHFIERLPIAFLDGEFAARTTCELTNVRLLQAQYRALAEGNFQPAIDLMADDIEVELLSPVNVPICGCWRGKSETTAAIRRNFGALTEQKAEVLSVVAQGDTVALLAKEEGKVRQTGESYRIVWAQFFTFSNGKIVRMRGVAANQ